MFVLTLTALLLATQAPAQELAEPDNPVEEVVVTAERLTEENRRQAISRFVEGVSAPTQRGRLSRWDQGLCPGVVGLPLREATYIADRIAAEAQAVGLDVGGPGCRPDVLVLYTNDPAKAARDFRARFPSYFATALKRDRLDAGEGKDALRDFLTSEAPVRSWHVSRLSTSDGRPVSWVQLQPGVSVPMVQTTASSRLASNWKHDLSRALLIVDSRQMKGVSYEQLASYLAMISLAQLRPELRSETLPTIMTLFTDRPTDSAAADTLTEWDRAYLRGLYGAAPNAPGLNAQRGAIRREMMNTGR